MAQLRVVSKSDKPGQSFEDSARAQFEKALADTNGAILFIYETSNGFEVESTPALYAVKRGLIEMAFGWLHGDE